MRQATGLTELLIKTREEVGLTLYQAAQRMPNTSYQTLWHLEGRAKGKKAAAGPDIQLKTAVDIVSTYWPSIQLSDLMPECRNLIFQHLGGGL